MEDIEIIRSFYGGIRLRSESLFWNTNSERYKNFLERVFEIKGIEGIDTSPITETMRILYAPSRIKERELLDKLTLVWEEAKKSSQNKTPLILPVFLNKDMRHLRRYDDIITSWQVRHSSLGRLRIKHPLLYKRKRCFDYVQERLLKSPGIKKVTCNMRTESILVIYKEEKITKEKILTIVHIALTESLTRIKRKDKTDFQQALTLTSLGLAVVGDYFLPWLIPLNATLVCYSAKPTFDKARHNIIKKRKFSIEALDSLVTLGCLATGQIFAAALMSFLVGMGRKMLNKPSEESKRFLERVIYKVPRFAWLVKGKKMVEICIYDLKEGDRIVLNKGDIIPVDGVIYKGSAVLDERNFTGHLNAVKKKKKQDEVFASTKIISGRIYVKVKKTVQESIIAKVKETVLNSANHKMKMQHIGERVQEHAVLPTLGASFLGYGVGGFDSAMAVITADYGTGIKITAPMGFLATLGMATKQRIFIKNGVALERLADVNTIIFKDRKSLMQKEWEVKDIIRLKGVDREEILGYSSSGAGVFYSPLSKALIAKAKELKADIPKVYRTNGMMVTDDGISLVVGNNLLLESLGIQIPSWIRSRLSSIKSQEKSLILVALDGKLIGAVEVGHGSKFLATDILQDFKMRDIEEIIFAASDKDAGDKELTRSLGIEHYYAGLSPKEENSLINKLHKQGKKIAVISDTYNGYLLKPDVLISFNGLSDIDKNNADIILCKEDFLKLPLVLDISQHLKKKTRRTMGMIAVPNTICICGAMFGMLGFVPTLLLNSGCNFAITLSNSIPLYHTYEEELQEEYNENKY